MEVSLQQMCRTCLGSGVALISLHANPAVSQVCTVGEMLGNFTTIKVSEDDGLPNKVCLACVSEIKRSYFFKIKCESSQDTLQQYLKEVSIEESVKQSPTSPSPTRSHTVVETYTIAKEEGTEHSSEAEEDLVSKKEETEIITNNECEDVEMLQVQQVEETEELVEVHEIQAESYDMNDESTMYEINEFLENSSDGEIQQDARVVIIVCETCCHTFENKEDFEAHAATCKKEPVSTGKRKSKAASRSPKKCPECPMDFVHQKNLDKHIRKCHRRNSASQDEERNEGETEDKTNNEDDEDDDEDATQPLLETLPEDALLKHDPTSLPTGEFTCPRCGAGFVNRKSFQCHMKINKCTEKQFICKFCEKVFINDKSLIEHIKTHAKAFKCSKCTKSFSKAEKLQAHTEKAHSGAVKNQCKFCGKCFTMYSTLKDHMRTHSGEKPFLCSICGKGFSQNTNLKQHIMRHKNLKPFACKDCDLSFVSKGELNAHVRKHTGDHPFNCDMCSSSFTTSSSLVKHKRIHTGERPYACDLCPMRFAALGTLRNHRRTHTGEKPFKCDHCSRSFAQKSDCVTHMRSHTGERPYTCSVCGWGFPQSGTLKTHMKTHERERERERAQSEGDSMLVEMVAVDDLI